MAYITVAELRSEVQAGVLNETSAWDDVYQQVCDSVSEAIDDHTFRSFEVPTTETVRYYRPDWVLTGVDELDDIANTTGLQVATDVADIGTYTTLDPSAYAAEVAADGRVVAIRSTTRFPYSTIRPRTIKVTARFGWPAVPAPVKRAALIWGVRLVNRQQSPAGVVGFGDFGAIRLQAMDPDVRSLLAPYRDYGRLVR